MKKFTIFALVVAITAVFIGTAMAAEWNLYGSARMETFYKDQDLPSDDLFGRSDVSATTWQFQNNSRVGATVKADKVEGRFEYGARPAVRDNGAVTNFANVRRLYGIWHFADGWGLKVGKDYTPITFFLSGQVVDADAGLLQVGNAYGARKGLVEVDGQLGPGLLKVALIDTGNTTAAFPATVVVNGTTYNVSATSENTIPKLEVSYNFKLSDAMSFHGFGGYQYFKQYFAAVNGAQVINTDDNVSSYMFGAGADLNFGPMFVKPQASWYKNGAIAGWLGSRLAGTGGLSVLPILTPGGDITDVDSLMAMLALGFKPTESLGLEAGAGYLRNDADTFTNNYWEAYIQAVFSMYPGVYLVPEVGYRDYGDIEYDNNTTPDQDLGSQFYAGLKWQIDF